MTLVINIMNSIDDPKYHCNDICYLFRSPETITSQGTINQHFCHNCNEYLFPSGITGRNKTCKCCGNVVQYIESSDDEYNKKIIKKSVSHSFTKNTFGRKNYDDFLEFINDNIKLRANYQLVVMKLIIENKMCTKYQLAEELAYQNNADYENKNEVNKFLSVPVYDVLENHEFIKKIIHNGNDKYILNIQLNEFQSIRCIEILEKKIEQYNTEFNIPLNQFDSLNGALEK